MKTPFLIAAAAAVMLCPGAAGLAYAQTDETTSAAHSYKSNVIVTAKLTV